MTNKPWPLIVLIALLRPATCWAVDGQPVDFNRDIRPILSDRCFKCHGPDAATREAGLRLDRRESATGKLESDATAIVPSDVAASELARRIRATDADER